MGNRNAVGKKGNGKLGNVAIVFVHGSFCPVDYFVLCASTFIHCTYTRAEHEDLFENHTDTLNTQSEFDLAAVFDIGL